MPTPRTISARSETWNLIWGLIRTTGVFKDSLFFCYCCCYCKCYLCMSLSAHPPAHCESYRRRHDSFFFSFFFFFKPLSGMEGQSYWVSFFYSMYHFIAGTEDMWTYEGATQDQGSVLEDGQGKKRRLWPFSQPHSTYECSMHFILHTIYCILYIFGRSISQDCQKAITYQCATHKELILLLFLWVAIII